MACSVLGLGCSISRPPITSLPNIRMLQPPNPIPPPPPPPHIQQKLLFIRTPSPEFHSSWITRNTAAVAAGSRRSRESWISAISAIDDDINAHSPPSNSTLPSRISPWLMLPPSFEEDGNMMVYNFYSLKDDKVLSINKRDPGVEAGDDDEPADDSELVGSSHGWLVLYNRRNCDLFLSNPLSRRHIKLPPLHNLPEFPKPNLEHGSGGVKSVILSSSPDDKDCRALMIYGPTNRLAFCCPGLGGSNAKWTTISKRNYAHEACVYSSRQKLFFSLNSHDDLQVLDIVNSSPPRSFIVDDEPASDDDDEGYPWPESSEEELFLKESCQNTRFLVVAEPNSTANLLLVCRHTMREMYPDGSNATKEDDVLDDYHYDANGFCASELPFLEYDPDAERTKKYLDDYNLDADGMRYPYKTIDFTVHKYGPQKNTFKYMDGSLDGLAIFIGKNHSFAMRACDFPELKPDSIYFTDVPSLITSAYDHDVCNFGGHDIGIYNYKDKTFSPCYYPCDYQSIKRIEPAPMWFTPSPL